MKCHRRRTLVITLLLAAALFVCASGLAQARIVDFEIFSPTKSSPVMWAKPGSTVTVTMRVTVDASDWVTVAVTVDSGGWYSVKGFVPVPAGQTSASRGLSVSVTLPDGIADGSKKVDAMAYADLDTNYENIREASQSDAVYVDATPPEVDLGALPTTPTKNSRPTWTWSGNDPVNTSCPECSSGLDYFMVTLDGELPLQTTGTSFTPSSNLADGAHVLKVKAVDKAGNIGTEKSFLAVTIDTTPPEVPGMPRAESPTANWRPTWTWKATSGAVAYRVFLDGVAQPAGEPNGTAQPGTTFTPATDLADGWHDLQVTAVDALGNESAKSAASIVLVDGTSPAVPQIEHLPTYTKVTQVVFRWSSMGDIAGYDFSYIVGDGEEWTALEGITTQSYVVKDLDDGVRVKGRVRAYDSLRNTSGWSDTVSTTIDLTGPVVSITSPAAQKNTNLSTFTWTWTGNDRERGSGVHGYWVKFNDEAWSWTTEPVFTSSRLNCGANVLRVKGVDNLGNEGAVSAAPVVTLVDVAIFGLIPASGEHPINEISTIVFSVAGLYDGQVEVLLSNKPIKDTWRLVTVVNTPALAKFYVLLDDAVMQPGPLTVTIKIGDVTRFCDYAVLDRRTGFGFGRLRPW